MHSARHGRTSVKVWHWRKFDRMSLHNNGLDVELPAGANREKQFHPESARTTAVRQVTVNYVSVSKCLRFVAWGQPCRPRDECSRI